MLHYVLHYILFQMSGLMKTKLEKYLKLLYTSKITVEDLYESQPVDHRLDCCNIPNSDLKYATSSNHISKSWLSVKFCEGINDLKIELFI